MKVFMNDPLYEMSTDICYPL